MSNKTKINTELANSLMEKIKDWVVRVLSVSKEEGTKELLEEISLMLT